MISKEEMLATHKRIASYIHKTPVLTSSYIDSLAGCKVYFKCENFQKMGAFKMRGAVNAMLKLSEEEKAMGVVTHSSGNFAQAVALSAQLMGIKAYIVMPTNAPQVKKNAVIGYLGEVVDCEPTVEAREKMADIIKEKHGATFLHPYNQLNVIAGQGTAAMELINEISNLDYLLAPVGGGGLCSGSALATKYFTDSVIAIGCEPENANDAFLSLKKGVIIPQTSPDTIADGLRTSLGNNTFEILRNNVKEIILASETDIINAMKMVWERMKMMIEPSSAVTLAVVLNNKEMFLNKQVGMIVSGGNVDLRNLPFG